MTEPVKLKQHYYNNPRGEPLGAAYGWASFLGFWTSHSRKLKSRTLRITMS